MALRGDPLECAFDRITGSRSYPHRFSGRVNKGSAPPFQRLGGLMQTEQTVQKEKTPVLGDIPILGLLFQKNKVTEENTELVIYIVPYLDRGERAELEPEEEFDRLFEVFFE